MLNMKDKAKGTPMENEDLDIEVIRQQFDKAVKQGQMRLAVYKAKGLVDYLFDELEALKNPKGTEAKKPVNKKAPQKPQTTKVAVEDVEQESDE